MSRLPAHLQHLTDEIPAEKRADVEDSIATSPYLQQIMTDAVRSGQLQHIRLTAPGANEGGHYSDSENTIYISADTFTDFPRKESRLDAIVSTLGHETGHALNAERTARETAHVSKGITDGIRAAGQDGIFDATPLAAAYLHEARRDEAMAEIHGWNALASRIEHTQGRLPTQQEMLSRANASTDCVDGPEKNPRLEPGIILDPNMQMSDTRLPKAGPINLEPVAQCHFDQSRADLGAGGAANYTNYYGAYLIQQIADDTRNWVNPPMVKLDMAKLGLEKAQFESTGLRVGDEGFSLIDTSRGGYKQVTLRSDGSGIQGTPDEQSPARAASLPPPPMTDPAHAAHGMYLQAQGVLSRIEAAPGVEGLTQHQRQTLGVSAVAMSLSAEGWTFTGYDHAVPGRIDPQTGRPDTIFLVQGDLHNPAHQRIGIDVDQALGQSLERSSTVSRAVMQAREQAMALEQQRAEQKDMDGPQGPTMRIGARTMSPSQGAQSDGNGGGG